MAKYAERESTANSEEYFDDMINLFWVFGFPIVFALFFGLVFSGVNSGEDPKNMQIGLVDQDQSKLSQRFAERLDAEEALKLTPMPLEQARDQVRKGKLTAALIIKDNFSERNGMGFGSDDPVIQIMAAPARQMQSAYLQGIASKAQFQGLSDMFTDPNRAKEQFQTWRDNIKEDPDINPLLAATFSSFFDALQYLTGQLRENNEDTSMSDGFMSIDTISVERQEEKGKQPTQGFQITFPQCILWGILGCAATFAVSLVKEGIYALEGAIWRHFSFTEMLMPCGVLLVIGAVFFAVGAAILGRRNG